MSTHNAQLERNSWQLTYPSQSPFLRRKTWCRLTVPSERPTSTHLQSRFPSTEFDVFSVQLAHLPSKRGVTHPTKWPLFLSVLPSFWQLPSTSSSRAAKMSLYLPRLLITMVPWSRTWTVRSTFQFAKLSRPHHCLHCNDPRDFFHFWSLTHA